MLDSQILCTYPLSREGTASVPNRSTKTIYTTLKPATKTYAFWSATTTFTDVLTTTSTVVPPEVSSTVTDTYTSQVTTTTVTFATDVVTSTSTTTSSLPGPTVYNACSSSNIFGPDFTHSGKAYYVANVQNNGPGVGSDFDIVADGASTATDCCAACQQLTGACETYIFRANSRNCFLLTHSGETCSSQFNHPNYMLSTSGSDTGSGYTVGNGNCGYTYSGNSDSSVFTVDGYP